VFVCIATGWIRLEGIESAKIISY